MESTKSNSRRNFLKAGAGAMGVMFTATVFSTVFTACEQNESMPIVPEGKFITVNNEILSKLPNVGDSLKHYDDNYSEGNFALIIYRKSDKDYVVYDEVCPHAGSLINLPEAGSNKFICPSHFAEFSVNDGSRLKNPNTGESIGGLKKFTTSYDDATKILKIYIS